MSRSQAPGPGGGASWRDARGLFVFSPPWLEAREEASEDRALERKLRAESFKRVLRKEASFNHPVPPSPRKLGGFFVLSCLFLAPEIYESFGQNVRVS